MLMSGERVFRAKGTENIRPEGNNVIGVFWE